MKGQNKQKKRWTLKKVLDAIMLICTIVAMVTAPPFMAALFYINGNYIGAGILFIGYIGILALLIGSWTPSCYNE